VSVKEICLYEINSLLKEEEYGGNKRTV